ncbi:uncharacterized protein [Miscanthus floridulus]|uniref:uncharacterized protein n=1 Tax=Miscanthus floridulus TaxID=154761 RepID=UPI00345A0857
MRWLHKSTRTHIKPPYIKEAIDEDSKEDVIEDVYDVTTREDTQLQRAPLQKYMATQLSRLFNEAAFRLHESRGQGLGVLEAFVEKVKKSCRKLVQKLSCIDTPYEELPLPTRSGGTSLASLRTPADPSQPMTGATSAVRTSSHHSAGKDPATEDDDDDDDDPRASADSTTSGTIGRRTRSACLS